MKKFLLFIFLIFSFSCMPKKEENVIKTAIIVDLDSLDPYKMVSGASQEVLLNVYEGLVKPDSNGDISMAIAKDYSVSEDGKTYTFEIRDDVYFHNGDKLSVEDVVFSLEKMKELKVQSAFLNIDSIKSEDNKVIVTLQKEDASFIYYLIQPIVSKKSFDTLADTANGTGPYMVDKYVRTLKLELKKNDKYYGDKASVDRIDIDVSSNFESSFLKFLSGDYNFLSNINSKRIKEVKDAKIEKNPQNMLFILAINNDKYDINVRRALNSAIDKEEIIEKVTNSYAKKIGNDTKTDTSILKDMKFVMKVPINDRIYTEAAQVIKEQLSKVGAKVEIKAIEWATWLQEVYTDKDFELSIIGFLGKLDKDTTYRRYQSDYKRNFSNFKNKEFDEILNLAKHTSDRQKRDELYNKANEILLEDQASVFIMDPYLIVVMNNNVEGYTSYTVPFIDFSKLKIKGN